ncbi:helix-turn-helix transcriptional regulator [Streptomyces sp. NPDC050704]|uniref:helix-turn-helix domain-containing protein n=1 Tax=Streptomyces sp. NPDC050704 TaxID=3157219 RepID=UPI00343EE7A8
MLEQSQVFGPELRRLRLAAGLTLTQLASSVHYSKSQISKIETGHKRATTEFARLCDATLDAGGTLSALVPADERRPRSSPLDQAGAMPPTNAPDEPPGLPPSSHWPPPTRRQMMTASAASVLTLSTADHTSPPPEVPSDGTLLSAHRGLLDQYRRIAQLSPPDALIPALAEHTKALHTLSAQATPRTGNGLLALSARFAEFTGWMAQEAGDDEAAVRWTDHAVALADVSGDQDLASYALVRRALITYYQGKPADTIALAAGALSDRLPPRIRGLAAQRRAQGHALAGDYDACMRDLDRARDLLVRATADTAPTAPTPVLGPTHLDDPVSMITGWCLLDLGRPRQAADLLDRECARLPAHALRTQARYGTRRALAHAVAGELDHACELTTVLLATTASVTSATITTDLRRLSRILSRHPHHPAYQSLAPRLAATIAPSAH